MTIRELRRNLEPLSQAIDACLKSDLRTPALILLYSAIEIAGFLDNEVPSAGSRRVFENWVKKYLLPVKSLYCSAVDIYAARCGVIHTFTPESDLSKDGRAREILYAWNRESEYVAHRYITKSKTQDSQVVVTFHDLYEGWKRGIEQFIGELTDDPQRRRRVLERAQSFFDFIEMDIAGRSPL
jgi:hypothetical protein